ncbi:hypothetical protein K440DRAFT_334185 [Wilcoxina mikolae CBS 423.85]|nr:hypothetical protein K440DRAFT_334185 [Wilcoxina mikolae CBS 423.85]
MMKPTSVVMVLPLVERLISPHCADPIPPLPMASITCTWSLESMRTGLKGSEEVEGLVLGATTSIHRPPSLLGAGCGGHCILESPTGAIS